MEGSGIFATRKLRKEFATLGPPSGLGEASELLAEGKFDEGLLTPAAEAGPKRVEQGDREREQGQHDSGEPARSCAHSPDCRGWWDVRYALPYLTQQRRKRPIR